MPARAAQASAWCLRRLLAAGSNAQRAAAAGAVQTLADVLGPPPGAARQQPRLAPPPAQPALAAEGPLSERAPARPRMLLPSQAGHWH